MVAKWGGPPGAPAPASARHPVPTGLLFPLALSAAIAVLVLGMRLSVADFPWTPVLLCGLGGPGYSPASVLPLIAMARGDPTRTSACRCQPNG